MTVERERERENEATVRRDSEDRVRAEKRASRQRSV